jgi:chromosome segregation protein
MFLKSIEIRGFKSFADKTDLSFKYGITAVVGPNGSGKSNISDAVRWVLGEQSVKSLRGGKMEDVIFAGTQFRKPVGLAQVALTLDNNDHKLQIDYNDVTISRRLYRSGESEYYINNTQCRLKDVHELFMDTGIGKEGYSIIGQGKIDAILSGRPEERRNLLEEAAGIVKFKTRKEEAEKRLENTEQNLVRINDILSTYEDRLEPLREENEKAKEFIKLSEELKANEISVVLYSIESINAKLQLQKNELIKLQDEIDRIFKERDENKEGLFHWNTQLDITENKSKEDREYYYNLKNKQSNASSEIKILLERIDNHKIFIERTSRDMNVLEAKIENSQNIKLALEQEVISSQRDQKDVNDEILKVEVSVTELNKLILQEDKKREALREEAIELLRKVSDVRNEITILKNEVESSKRKVEQIKIASENYRTAIMINSSTKLAIEEELNKFKDEISENEENIKTIKKEMLRLNSELYEEENDFKKATSDVNKFDANYNMLINLEKQYEGYAKSVKNLMQHIDNGRIPKAVNNCYVLGNVINVDSKLETAIEIALGGAISDIITKDEGMAKELINYLKSNSLGRATFLPLDILKGKTHFIDKRIESMSGFIGIASELISYDPIFLVAIRYVLGKTLIADNMDNALRIAKMSNFSIKIVTLSGEVINPGGSLTGGSIYQKSANVIGRKREIEDLENRIKETRKKISTLTSQIELKKKNIKELDEKNLNIRDDIHFKQIELTKLESKITSIVEETERLKLNYKTSKDEIDNLEKSIYENETMIFSKEEEVKLLTEQEQINEKAMDICDNIIKTKQEELKSIKDDYMLLKIKKAQVDESVLNKIKELERMSKELESSSEIKSNYIKEIDEATENLKLNKIEIENTNKNIESMASQIEEMEVKFNEYDVSKIELREKIKKFTDNIEEFNLILSKKEEEKHKSELSQAKQEAEKEALFLKLNDELEMTYAEALECRKEVENIDNLKKEITFLKGKISMLGVVNLGAIEEYEIISEKFSFMSIQKEDLINAKDELITVISEMTENMKKVFNENFKKLKENFNETFRELFKGGSADLILSDGDELMADIDINVQPPGKKLQNINLMSGGEKVLSAIALLFAILKMKPTPFCILDEIEAALDDANVTRYAEFLKKFSENIQFIVITHRKGTMEASDTLYGVTMEEKGVSKIVSVDLSKAK